MKQYNATQTAKAIAKYNKIVEDAMVDLCLDFEIIGYMALNIGGVKVVDNIYNAVGWTDYKSIYVNAVYADKHNLNKEHIKFLIAHEVFHILILTRSRREGRDPSLWNKASDFAINELLINDEAVVTGKTVGQFIDFGCYDPAYRNMSAEQIYNLLKKEQDKLNNMMNNMFNNSENNQQDNSEDGDQENQTTLPSNNSDNSDPEDEENQSTPSSNNSENSEDEDEEESQGFNLDTHLDLDDPEIQEDLREAVLRVNQILESSAAQGKLSNGMKRLIDSLPKVKENWRYNLEKYIKSFKKAESTWKRPNKRYSAAGFYLPTRFDTPELKLAIGIDTSGSIGKEELSKFFAHVLKITKSFKTFEIQVFCWSTMAHENTLRIVNEKNYRSFNPLESGYIESFGGTIAQSCFDFTKTLKTQPDCLIVFSDGYFESEIKDFNSCPTIFAITDNDSFNVPDGIKRAKIIKVED